MSPTIFSVFVLAFSTASPPQATADKANLNQPAGAVQKARAQPASTQSPQASKPAISVQNATLQEANAVPGVIRTQGVREQLTRNSCCPDPVSSPEK